MTDASRFVLVLTTTDSDDLARKIAETLVERHLAACVNIASGVYSVYRWKGEICQAHERLLVIKTTAARFPEVRNAIRELHTYDLPEAIMIPLEGGDREYLDWIGDCLVPEAEN